MLRPTSVISFEALMKDTRTVHVQYVIYSYIVPLFISLYVFLRTHYQYNSNYIWHTCILYIKGNHRSCKHLSLSHCYNINNPKIIKTKLYTSIPYTCRGLFRWFSFYLCTFKYNVHVAKRKLHQHPCICLTNWFVCTYYTE